jgi:DNA polymerase III epsilon subunit-like protein
MSLDSLPARGFVAIDLETTGLDRRRDRIVSLAAVRFVGDESATVLVTLVNPGQRIPVSSTMIHGIDDAMVEGAPDEASAVRWLDELCAGQVIAGHGVAFDIAVMARARRGVVTAPETLAALCTQRLAAALHPTWSDFSLEGVCLRLGVPVERRHTADGDAVMAGRLLVRLLPRLEQRGIRTLAEALWFQDRGPITD